jgi:formamidopyrimidine-DNA glycosylase
MPELPDVTVYVERLTALTKGKRFEALRLTSPFVLRTAAPSAKDLAGRKVLVVERLGKRIVFELEGEFFIIIHLMIAGRLLWKEKGAKPGGIGLAVFDFEDGSLVFTEASKKKRASIHLVAGRQQLHTFDRGGLEPLEASLEKFRLRLISENHTLKRSLTDPTLFSGIGNAYSDEILHRAKLSPVRLTQKLSPEEIEQLYLATREVLQQWVQRLREQTGDGFPEKVTAFRPEMAVHGKYKEPCPVCQTAVQRIVFAENECNYCPRCQTQGKLLADRSLSKLLKDDWPRSIDELEERKVTMRRNV